jgi:hypothetical protein
LVSFNHREKKSGERELTKTLLQPLVGISDYEFNKSLEFCLQLENSFPQATKLAEQFTLQNYNLVYKEMLYCKRAFHNANLALHERTQTVVSLGTQWRVGIKK